MNRKAPSMETARRATTVNTIKVFTSLIFLSEDGGQGEVIFLLVDEQDRHVRKIAIAQRFVCRKKSE